MDYKTDFIEKVSDFERWNEIFTDTEITSIKDFYIQCMESHQDRVVLRLLCEEIDKSYFPYYVWVVFEIEDGGVIESITLLEPETDEALLDCPDVLKQYPFLKLEERAFDIGS